VLHASNEREIDNAFATLAELRARALVIGSFAAFIGRSEQLAALALRHAMPSIFQSREFAVAGGLMSYTGSIEDVMGRRPCRHAGRIRVHASRADRIGGRPKQRTGGLCPI
jgi:putative ABC transport system substrate-binding protein